VAASVVLVVALAIIALPVTWLIGIVIDQAPDALRRVQESNAFARLAQLRVGKYQVGAEIAKASGTTRVLALRRSSSRSPAAPRRRH
jgi:hypothetical protein